MVIAVLSLAAYQYSALMDAEVMAAERIRKNAEAKANAESGIANAMALVADPTAFEGVLNSNPYDNQGSFYNQAVNDGQSPKNQGRFSLGVSLDFGNDLRPPTAFRARSLRPSPTRSRQAQHQCIAHASRYLR